MLEFTLFRIPIRVEMSFFVVLGVLGVLINQREPSELLVNAGLFVTAGFVSVLIHELGHALMVKKYGYPTQIVMESFGGYATHPIGVLSRLESFLVTLAGPLLQGSVGWLCWYIFSNHVTLPNTKIVVLTEYFIWVSLFWSVFNCLPVLPLDGGRMVEAALGPRRIKTTLIISMVTAGVVAILGLMNGFIFASVFMIMFGWQSYQAYERFK